MTWKRFFAKIFCVLFFYFDEEIMQQCFHMGFESALSQRTAMFELVLVYLFGNVGQG